MIEVFPCNFFGKRGKVLATVFQAPPQAKWTTVFECRSPMETLKFKKGFSGGTGEIRFDYVKIERLDQR